MKEKGEKKGTRTGFTTGACAAAAARGALLALVHGEAPKEVTIPLPAGGNATFALSGCKVGPAEARCGVVKDAGDDPDVTHGATIYCTVSFLPEPERLEIDGGEGVGRVTLPGLGLPVGAPDITRIPMKMITRSLKEAAGPILKEKGVRAVISVPGGEALAKKTELLRLGVTGGIGILGTIGIVKPYSTSAFRAGVSIAVGMAANAGYDEVVVTTGGMSEKFARKWIDLPEGAYIQMGDFFGYALTACVKKKIGKVTVSGMIGKLSKMAMGKMMTHAAGSEVDTDFLAEIAGDCGASEETLAEIRNANTARHVAEIVQARGVPLFFNAVCECVCATANRHVQGALTVACLMTDFEGNILGRASLPNTAAGRVKK